VRFVLVHGGTQGAWVWDFVVPELRQLGHEAVVVDLPGHGSRAYQGKTATLEGYRTAVLDVVRRGDVLVGHSMGGYIVSLVADAIPGLISHIVYLAAGVPIEGRSMSEASGGSDDGPRRVIMKGGVDSHIVFEPEGFFSIPTLAAAKEVFFHDCADAMAEWAFARMTPQPLAPLTAPIHIPAFWQAELPRSFILCTCDRALPRLLADRMIKRLNVSPLSIDASHSPFLSKPRETAETLVAAIATSPLGPPRPFGP
jgi:pimeloyl-ACP methyl ester carboxylesterase